MVLAADQSRLPANPSTGQRNIVASGGWCAPSQTVSGWPFSRRSVMVEIYFRRAGVLGYWQGPEESGFLLPEGTTRSRRPTTMPSSPR
ncbi:hypothetical protein GCM10010412_028710 [Nonomuraea recticatena]|uniref:Uncharacterized protein n=1 Tax=Nonomuraea recticatena TaxID=46178 RepID=A0ABN3RPQ2_9ACTN